MEKNATVDDLKSLMKDKPMLIELENHGDFEKVGALNDQLISNDIEMTVTEGDIVLYNGSNIVLFYGNNT